MTAELSNRYRRASLLWPSLLFLAIVMGLFIAILRINSGHFTYTLDDVYIHLALAENIAQGGYGLNLHEMSAPASSILWPFILAPFVWVGIAEWVPLMLNVLLSLGCLAVCWHLLWHVLDISEPRRKAWGIGLCLAALIPLLNLAGLTFTGMEHNLQLLLTLLLVAGLIHEIDTGRVSPGLMIGIVLGPLVRYENLALSGPAIMYLAYRRHWRASILLSGALGLALLAFSLFLLKHDLAYLPTSVMAKSDAAATGGRIRAVLDNLLFNFRNRQGTVLGMLLLPIAGAWILKRSGRSRDKALAAWACAAITLHLLVGSFGWFARYEMYIMTVALISLVYLYRGAVSNALTRGGIWRPILMLGALCIMVAGPYLRRALITPAAASNIYEQHAQMQRFVKDYWRRPTAAMDVGFVSYGHNFPILDLRGLGSLEALHHFNNRANEGADWMEELTTRYDTKLAILYKFYYHTFPRDWQVLGELHLGRKRVIAAFPVVTFYATDPDAIPELRTLLNDFAQTLPPGVRFTFSPSP